MEAELAATNSQLSEASSKARESALLLDSSAIASKHRSAPLGSAACCCLGCKHARAPLLAVTCNYASADC